MEWRIGCSGFYYREWKEIFYPTGLPQRDWFKFYCENFNTIEINATFYKMPTEKSLSKWHNDSPEDFLFTLKAPRLITHYKQLKNCTDDLNRFVEISNNAIKEKLACILFQFPPLFSYTEERLELLVNLRQKIPQPVVEFRHASWWDDHIYQQLTKAGIVFSGQDHPKNLPTELIANLQTVYYRFHGNPVLYKSKYSIDAIQQFIAQIPSTSKQVFVYFNNTWGSSAIQNAKELKELLHLHR